jgi:hypothetical protein
MSENKKDQQTTFRGSRTRVQVILDITYDCPPTRRNKIDIQKLLALELFRLGDPDCNRLTWQDVDVTYYNYKINLNSKNFSNFKKTTNYKKTQGESK